MDAFLNETVLYLATQSWQIALLTVAVAVITWILRGRSAHVRYLLWMIVLAKCLVPPLYGVPLHILPSAVPGGNPHSLLWSEWLAGHSGSPPQVSPEEPSTPVRESIPVVRNLPADGRPLSASAWLGIVWVLGAGAYISTNLLRALRGRHWLRTNRKSLPEDVQIDTSDMLRAYGMRRLPKVWMVEGVGQPFVWGALRGDIYVPPSFVAIRSSEHRRNVLAHELSHVLRWDAAVNALQVVAQAAFWFHPLVWWVNRRICVEREKCCDETAIARLRTQAKDYCSAVVETLANMRKSPRPVPSLAVAGPVRNIEERIRTMLKPGREFYQRPSLIAAAVVLLVAILTVPTTLVLSAAGGTAEAAAVQKEPVLTGADAKEPQAPGMVTAGGAPTTRLGDLIRTFQDPNMSGGSGFGYSIAAVGDNVVVGAPMNKAAYLFEGSTGKLLRTFVAPSTARGQAFGFVVGAAGSYVVVGDLTDETDGKMPDGRTTGRAYLFNGLTGELLHTFANPQPNDYIAFGQPVAGMGDDRVIVGATWQDRSVSAIFLFDASTGKMLHVFQKPKSATKVNPMYAYVTAIGENILVGAPEDDTGAEGAGCVYMFDGSTGKVVSTFLNPTPTAGDNFGNVIATAGNNVLIGAGYATIGGKRTGAAYLFDRGTGKLLHTFVNPAPGEAGETGQGDVFGRSVAFVGNNVLIGASLDDTGAQNAGAAYLFDGTTGKLLHKFVHPNPVMDARFGVQVAALGKDILIAAYGLGGNKPGAVYLFKGVD